MLKIQLNIQKVKNLNVIQYQKIMKYQKKLKIKHGVIIEEIDFRIHLMNLQQVSKIHI